MNAYTLYEALGGIRDDFILDAETASGKPRRSLLTPIIAACLSIVLLVLPVHAEMTTGYVSNLLAPLYGGAKTELVDDIGVPIGASATVGDYTLSADAVIGDRYNIAIVYTLTRADNAPIAEGTHFAAFRFGQTGGGSGGGSLSYRLSEDGTRLQIVERWTSTNRLFLLSRNINKVFTDLMLSAEGEDIVLMEGTWDLKFTIRYKDTTVKIPVHNLTVQDSNRLQYEICEILLSPIGIHIDLTAPNPYASGDSSALSGFTVSLLLSDGTIAELNDKNRGWSGNVESKAVNADFGAMFEEPIPLEQIRALIICDTTVPVELPR